MITALDTNVLLDVLTADPAFADQSESALFDAAREGTLIISEVVYAELAPNFDDIEQLEDFLAGPGIVLQSSGPESLFAAGEAWKRYLANPDRGLQCPNCGGQPRLTCDRCGQPVRFRQHIVSDFLVGGHALAHATRLLTRDSRYFGTHFPDLALA